MRRAMLHVAEAALAYWAIRAVFEYRPVVSWVAAVLPSIGVFVLLATLALVAGDVLAVLPEDGVASDVLARVGWWSRWLVVGFVWVAIALMVNARFDGSPPVAHRAQVVAIGARSRAPGAGLVHSWMDVRSRTLGESVRIPLGPYEQATFWRGEPVLVVVRTGQLGIPWIARIERDVEGAYRNVLARLPGARGPSQALVNFLIDHMRWEDARDESVRYLALHPEDVDFAVYAAGNMSVRGWLDTSAEMLRPAAARRPGRHLLSMLAWIEARRGDSARAVAVARAAAERYQDAWEFPLIAGWALTRAGDRPGAAAAFEEANRIRPGVAEVARAASTLRTATR
jgi:hypothetical protein